jgi:hypothetical protein
MEKAGGVSATRSPERHMVRDVRNVTKICLREYEVSRARGRLSEGGLLLSEIDSGLGLG